MYDTAPFNRCWKQIIIIIFFGSELNSQHLDTDVLNLTKRFNKVCIDLNCIDFNWL